jgi:Secretion system C-terminal sorting domain/Matrixin
MKKLLVFILIISNPVFAQTIIRFKANKIQIDSKNQEFGQIEQAGESFIGKTILQLGDKKINLSLAKSPIKNYKNVIYTQGEASSEVEIFVDCTQTTKYFIATINKKFYSLLMLENDNLSRLERVKDDVSVYKKSIFVEEQIKEQMDVDLPSKPDLANLRTNNVSGCVEFPIAFIVDFAQYQKYEGIENGRAKLEADNLLKIAAVQELFAPYAFNARINFKVIGQMVFDKPGMSPWPEDDKKINLGQLISYAATAIKKPLAWQNSKLLITMIITGVDYESPNIYGRGGSNPKESDLGQAIVKGFLDKERLVWVMAHELGHVFGASHDDGSIMAPLYEGRGYNFSLKSKAEINAVLNTLDTNKWLKVCPEILLNWDTKNDSLVFLFQTNYDKLGDFFTLEYSEDKAQTWTKIVEIKSSEEFKYQFTLPQKKEYISGLFYRVRQTGINNITSSNTYILLTLTEEKETIIQPIVFLDNINNKLIIRSLQMEDVKVYDIYGRQLLNESMKNHEHTIDLSMFSAGIYIVRLEGKSVFTYKVFKTL